MSGPIIRKYGFPNFEKIFGERKLEHGADIEETRRGHAETRQSAQPPGTGGSSKDQPGRTARRGAARSVSIIPSPSGRRWPERPDEGLRRPSRASQFPHPPLRRHLVPWATGSRIRLAFDRESRRAQESSAMSPRTSPDPRRRQRRCGLLLLGEVGRRDRLLRLGREALVEHLGEPDARLREPLRRPGGDWRPRTRGPAACRSGGTPWTRERDRPGGPPRGSR